MTDGGEPFVEVGVVLDGEALGGQRRASVIEEGGSSEVQHCEMQVCQVENCLYGGAFYGQLPEPENGQSAMDCSEPLGHLAPIQFQRNLSVDVIEIQAPLDTDLTQTHSLRVWDQIYVDAAEEIADSLSPDHRPSRLVVGLGAEDGTRFQRLGHPLLSGFQVRQNKFHGLIVADLTYQREQQGQESCGVTAQRYDGAWPIKVMTVGELKISRLRLRAEKILAAPVIDMGRCSSRTWPTGYRKLLYRR